MALCDIGNCPFRNRPTVAPGPSFGVLATSLNLPNLIRIGMVLKVQTIIKVTTSTEDNGRNPMRLNRSASNSVKSSGVRIDGQRGSPPFRRYAMNSVPGIR
jgi:hypothetical protein